MSDRFRASAGKLAVVVAVALLIVTAAVVQAQQTAPKTPAKVWTKKTPDGQPDLPRSVWSEYQNDGS